MFASFAGVDRVRSVAAHKDGAVTLVGDFRSEITLGDQTLRQVLVTFPMWKALP